MSAAAARKLFWLRFAGWFLIITSLLCCFTRTTAAESRVTEYHIKAVFLFNLTHFVSWPNSGDGNRPFIIGIYGNDPFGEIIDQTVRGEKLGNREIQVLRYSTTEELGKRHSDILFVGSEAIGEYQEIRKVIQRAPVLTVADTPGFPAKGGMINLLKDQQKIIVEINRKEVHMAGLFISSKLLGLARILE